MRGRGWLSLIGACAVLLVTSRSWAQCTMDAECSGEDVCENGQCVAPATAPPVAAAPPAAAPSVAVLPAAAAPASVAAAPLPQHPQPTMVRHSTGMMVAGMLMLPLGGAALLLAASESIHKSICNGPRFGTVSRENCYSDGVLYGSLLTGVALIVVGIPMIAIGARKEPAKPKVTATLTPWATPTSVGVGLRISL